LNSIPYDNENIYNLTIRLHGNIQGITSIINQVNNINDNINKSIEYENIIFKDYTKPENPVKKDILINHKVRENQSIYDLAVQLGGNLKGLEKIINNFSNLDEDLKGEIITVIKKDEIVSNYIQNKGFIFATKDIEVVISNWILANNIWDDSGIWIDTETWND
jgi:predicted RND superfamily exporter protein